MTNEIRIPLKSIQTNVWKEHQNFNFTLAPNQKLHILGSYLKSSTKLCPKNRVRHPTEVW